MRTAAGLAGALLAAACAAPAPTIPPAAPLPQPGDSWTYSLAERGIGRAPTQSSYVVTVAAASAAEILDRASRDGAPPVEWMHRRGRYIGLQGVAMFSPYLAVFEAPLPGPSERVEGCFWRYVCVTRATVVGRETIRVPAGSFDALKVSVEHEWKLRPVPRAAHEEGVLRLTVWYAPQAKRAVKVSSRLSGDGGRPPYDADFDLELVSYQLR